MIFIPTNMPLCQIVGVDYNIELIFVFALLLVANFVTVIFHMP